MPHLGLAWLQPHASFRTELHVGNPVCCMKTLKASQRADQILSELVPCTALFCGCMMRREVVKTLLPKEEKRLLGATVDRISPDHVVLQSVPDPRMSGRHLLLASPRMICNAQNLGMFWKIYEREGLPDYWSCWSHPPLSCEGHKSPG